MADELIPYSDPATGFTPLGSDPGSINESVIPKSRPLDPSPDHVEALRLNPEFSTDFDSKFGAGASAKYLAQSAGNAAPVAEPEKPGRYRPALTWSTADILAANKPENPIAPMADAFVDSQVRKLQATRDGAALTSVEAFMRGPGPKTKADWLDDEIRSAEWSVGYWQQEMAKTDVGRIAYNADYERAHARLEAARKAKLDLEDKSERTAEPQVQIAIASRIADQKGRVAYAEDQLEAAKDGDLGTGLNVKQYEENLRYERKKLNALETAMDYARQKKAVDGASATGEMGRSFLRSMLAETPEMLAGAVEQISKNFGSEYGQMANEIAGEVKSIAKGLKQDMPAPKQSEILALDPKSPAFANNLKLYAAHAMGQGVGSTTAFWLAAAVGGPATAGGMGITLGIGQMRNALEEEFAKEGLRLQDHDVDAIVYSYGTAIGMLDAYGAMFNLNMLGREVKTAAVRGMASAIARGAAKGAIVEGTTEGLQEAIQMLGENYALDRNMDWTKFRDRVIENFAAGSIPGMAFGAKNAHTEQGSARARAEYEKILKEIEAQSTLKPGEQPAETQAPTVSSQPETVSGVETEQRGGRPLPPVQAEVRDPATIPKPEPVSPQPETLSELSTQEKTDLVEVAKESGIAREGEAPEETLQRMREQRAEGASFGKYDAVFDRLDAVEQELEQQRAKDATIQPDDVEAIVDMWRFVNEAARVKDPEGLIDFLRRSGGIVDFNGDVTSTLGEARMRPGLISNSGLPLDAAARLAWDHGFLTSVERPDINALLDAINEDHAGNRVVRGSDRSTLDDLKIARDMAEELSQFGIRKGMKENEVRDALKGITREGGSGTQDVAANPRGPQPRTIDQVFKGEALASYLERGGQTDVSAWPQIAEALGIELKDVGPALDAAVADGTLRKHDGRYWRNQDVFADDIPFALAGQSKEAAAQAELDKHEQVQALVRLAIGSGQAVNVPKEITERIVSAMRDVAHVIPEGVHAGAISRIEPIKTGDGMYPDDDVMVTYLTVTGDSIETTMPLSFILSSRALFDHSVGGIFSTRLFVGQQASNAIAGEVHHESLHARWRHLDGSLRDRLFAHSDTLGVLDMQMGTYLTIVGDPTAAYVQSTTLREAYEERYAGRANFEDVMRQEAVAHLVELASHGYFSEAELAPIAADLAELGGQSSSSVSGDILAALSGSDGRLDMSPEARKARAEQMGFDTTTVWYHGTDKVFDAFNNAKIKAPEGDTAHYFTRSLSEAADYADQNDKGGSIIPVYLNPSRMKRVDLKFRLYDLENAELLTQARREGYEGILAYVNGKPDVAMVTDPRNVRSVNATFDPAEAGSARLLAALSGSDAAVGRSMRADLDKLGYYSKALEAAKSLKQAKGTPEQMLSQLKSAGVKDAEIEATNLRSFLDGKASITRDEIVKHLTENRVGVNEVVTKKRGAIDFNKIRDDLVSSGIDQGKAEYIINEYAQRSGRPSQTAIDAVQALPSELQDQFTQFPDTKWHPYSLDPSNPTYRETVLHLPTEMPDRPSAQARVDALRASVNEPGISFDEMLSRRRAADAAASEMAAASSAALKARQSAFQSGHFPEPNIIGHMMTSMNRHEGQPVFTLDQIQSDWGQRIRDAGGARGPDQEAKVAALREKLAEAEAAYKNRPSWFKLNAGDAERMYDNVIRLQAELRTAEASPTGHPLVNTTDQWTNTTLRRALRQAVEADAEFIAIPHGDTVLSYNPGDESGMRGFYGSRTSEGIVPKNLRKLLEKIDKDSAKPTLIDKLETPSGMKGSGFTLFPLTDKVKRSVMEEGQALFALSGYRQGRNVTEPENLRFWQKPPASGDVLMFHGTRKTFDKFDMSYSRDFGVHFGTAEQASERLVTTDMEGARTIPVEITLKNAIVMPDPGFWGPTEVAGGLMRAGYQVSQAEFDRFQRLAVAIDEAANGNDPKATRSAIIAANQAIAEKLNALGIDGIWYRNRHEGTGWSLTVWNKGQVRSATSNDVLMAMRPSIANRPMPDSQRRVATAGTAEPARSLSQLVADLNQALGLTTRVGRLSPGLKAQASAAGGKLRGQYNTATDVTRLAIPLDIETLSHEGGHALEERFGLPLRVLMEANAKELEKLATPGKDQLSEGFAEFIRRYVTNPNMAEARAPKFFKAFEQFVDKVEPSLLKRLHEVTTGYQDWINAPSGGAVLSTIKSAKKDGLVAELTKHARKNGFRNVAVDYFHSAYTAIIDGLHPVKMAVDKLIDIANTNLATPLGARSDVGVIAARDPYKLLRLARNAYQGGHVDLMRGVRDYHTHEHKGPSLHDAIGVAMGGFESSHWTDENIKAFGAYLISRRMVAEWNRFKAGELEGMPDKLSQADHIQAQKDFEQQFPQFIDAAELVYQYQRNLLRKAMEAGFVSEDTYEDLIKRSDYVPAHRDMSEDAEETVAGPGAQTVGANKARLLKQFRGSTRDIINPLETIAKTTYEWNFLIARNDAIKALDRLARAVGPGGGKIAERIPSSQMSGTQVNAIEIVKRAGKQAGMDEADLLFLTNTLEEQLGDDADTVIFRPGEITEGGEPIVYLWEGGKRVAIRLADGKFGKDMYEAITGIGRENLGPILELVAKPSQWLRAGVTLDPAFVAANWIRDNPAAWINSADHGTFLPRADRSLRASVDALRAAFGTKVDDLDILSSTGGIVGGAGMEGMSASRIERDIKALQKKGIRIRDALPHKKQFWELTGVTETGTRLSVFRAARERALADGLDEYEATVEAAYTANDLIDFGRHGSKMLAARRLVTFLNAFVQGIDKGIRTGAGGSEVKRAVQDVISPYVRQSDGQVLTVLERKAVPVAAQFYMKMTMIGFVGFALSAVYKDDPEYEEIPEYFRNTHWIFKDATGTWRRVPKPFELGAMSLVMERTFEAYYKGDTKAMKRLVSGLGDLVAPPHVVPGVQVAYELWANKSSFTGGPIVPPNLEKLPGELQFTAYTSELSKWMAVGTGVSAAKIDHAIAGITGSLGRSLLDKSNVIMPPVGMFLQERGMPTLGLPTTPRPEQRDVDRIFVRRFTVDPARSSESKKEFWKEMSTTNGEMAIKAAGYKEFYDRAQFDEAAQTLKRMKEHERVYALVEGHGNATDKREHPMNRAKSVLEVTNGIRRDLDTGKMKDDNGNAYSPSDRRVIQEMFEQIQMREARNAQIVLGLPGFTHLKIMPVEPVIRELEAKVPSIAEELDYRLRKARVKDFDEVRDGYADLKARVLEPDYVEANPPRRKVGRRSP